MHPTLKGLFEYSVFISRDSIFYDSAILHESSIGDIGVVKNYKDIPFAPMHFSI